MLKLSKSGKMPCRSWSLDYKNSLRLYFYPYSIVALVDLDTRESKIGRFD